MELKYLLLLMVLLYLLPELLRRRKPKKYEYPDFPEKVPGPQPFKRPAYTTASSFPPTPFIPDEDRKPAVKPAIPMPSAVDVPQTTDTPNSWQGQLQPAIVQNGLIFAEILQPPRAYRPFQRTILRR